MKKYFENILKVIDESIRSMDETAFNRLLEDSVETLEQGKKIIVSGLGKNVPVCDKFVGTMISLGQNASFMNTNSAIHGDFGMVHKDDLVILLTKSGETQETIQLAELLKKRDVRIWLLSFQKDSTLSKMLENNLLLHLQHEGDAWNVVPNNSTTINLLVLQGLAMNIAERRGVTLLEFKKNHPGGDIGNRLRSYSEDEMEQP